MLSREELETSPLFQGISYENYLLMIECFHAVQKSYRPEELIYDFGGANADTVGLVERGTAALIRIDEAIGSRIAERSKGHRIQLKPDPSRNWRTK